MSLQVSIPRAVQLVLDDVGWREGWPLNDTGGPYRAGIDRLLDVRDYDAIADIGEALSVRPTAAMILCEWDRENVCARHPTATQAGAAWDNSSRAGDWSDEAAEVFLRRTGHIELCLHGVGHEHWEDGAPARAEWLGPDGVKWDWDALLGHLECFRDILDQHGLGPGAGHRCPIHCVPAAFRYLWDENDPTDTGALMATAGVQMVSTPFGGGLYRRTPLLAADGGIDHGVLVIDRGHTAVPWYELDSIPAHVGGGEPTGRVDGVQYTSVCGIHWPNVLREDPKENDVSVRRWTDYLRSVARQPGVMLAANIRECVAQWAYQSFGRVEPTESGFVLDTAEVPAAALDVVGDLPIVVEIEPAESLARVTSDSLRPVWYRQTGTATYVAFAGPSPMQATVEIEAGDGRLEPMVVRDGTFNVLDLRLTDDGLEVELEVFGTQDVPIAVGSAPSSVEPVDGRLSVDGHNYDRASGITTVTVSGRDIQGQRGMIRLRQRT